MLGRLSLHYNHFFSEKQGNILRKQDTKPEQIFGGTLFEIFIFCPKIQLWFPEKIVDFLGEKLAKMLWF